MISKIILLFPLAYLFGSVPWGIILTRLFSDVDIRKAGSGNIGAHNVYRLAGKKLAVLTLIGDMSKGAVPLIVVLNWVGDCGWKNELLICIIAMAAFLGHTHSIFLGFKGGKGVATVAGCFLIISPMVFGVCALVYILVLCICGYSSVGSLSAAAALPGAIWLDLHSVPILLSAIIMTLLIYVRHADNIRRLMEGTEHSSLHL